MFGNGLMVSLWPVVDRLSRSRCQPESNVCLVQSVSRVHNPERHRRRVDEEGSFVVP